MKVNAAVRITATAMVWGVPLAVETAALLRSVVLAWGIGAENLGRALILVLILRLAEMLSDVGIERLLQVSPRRDNADFMAALHGASLVRGALIGLVLLAIALPMAASLADGASVASYAALALVPLVRGMLHLDYRRSEARRKFVPMALVEGMSTLIMLAAMTVMVMAFGDERAMLGLILVQVGSQVVLSHLVAERAYSLRFDIAVMRQLWQFGTPLVLNAGLMFMAIQADRFVVAGFYGWSEVATYGIAFQLASLTALIAGRTAASGFTSVLAGPDGKSVLQKALWQFSALAVVFAFGFTLLAPSAIGWLYGAGMQPSAALALGMGLTEGLRILRTPLSVRAIALGKTGGPARVDLWRAAALVPAIFAAILGLPLAYIAFSAVLGEIATTGRNLHLMQARTRRVFPLVESLV